LAAKILYRLASAYSPTGSEEEAARVLVYEATRLGLEAMVDCVGNVYVSNTSREPLVGLVGHIDTVEGYIEPVMLGDTVTGRGVVDAKGSIAAMLVALTLLDKSCPAMLLALVGEEGDSRGARHVVREGLVPPYVIVGEPTGSTRIAVGYHGGFKATIKCTSSGGHPANPEGSALDLLLELVQEARKNLQGMGSQLNITVLHAGESPRKLPREAQAIVDVRIAPGNSTGLAVDELRRLALERGCKASLLGEPTEPIRVKPQDPVPRALARALLVQGVRPVYTVKRGTSDMNLLAPHAKSIAAYGPGDPRLSHTDHEEVGLWELALAVETYRAAVEYLCKSLEQSEWKGLRGFYM
jgi:LysW-gamma-L-lysine carboxypeptidase